MAVASFIFGCACGLFQDLPGATFFNGCINRGSNWNRKRGYCLCVDNSLEKNSKTGKAMAGEQWNDRLFRDVVAK